MRLVLGSVVYFFVFFTTSRQCESSKPIDFNVLTDCDDISGDGTADITMALQKCINNKLSQGFGGKVFFPSGTYRIDGTIDFGVFGSNNQPLEVTGQGRTTKIMWASAGDLFIFGGDNGEGKSLRLRKQTSSAP